VHHAERIRNSRCFTTLHAIKLVQQAHFNKGKTEVNVGKIAHNVNQVVCVLSEYRRLY